MLGCDRRQSPQSTVPETQLPKFARQEFVTVEGNNQISLISNTECEISGGREIVLGEYQRQGNTLRLVIKAMGTNIVQYYDITSQGLRDRQSGQFFATPEIAARERQRLKQEAEAKQQAEIAAAQARQKAENERKEALEAARTKLAQELMSDLNSIIRKGRVFQATHTFGSSNLPYELKVLEDAKGKTTDGITEIFAKVLLSAKPGIDGKIRLINYYDEGKGTNDLPGDITFRFNRFSFAPGATPVAEVHLNYIQPNGQRHGFWGDYSPDTKSKTHLQQLDIRFEKDGMNIPPPASPAEGFSTLIIGKWKGMSGKGGVTRYSADGTCTFVPGSGPESRCRWRIEKESLIYIFPDERTNTKMIFSMTNAELVLKNIDGSEARFERVSE